ncbi:unnamed protein product [Echinostoma caproni]|uniref:Copine domain-containing protein n=1 Tax=Echinostoma caproni TaxID=27848 RepID=A0A183A551_9TREM|nr:unnamed protein product [Echinostoma caproni]
MPDEFFGHPVGPQYVPQGFYIEVHETCCGMLFELVAVLQNPTKSKELFNTAASAAKPTLVWAGAGISDNFEATK